MNRKSKKQLIAKLSPICFFSLLSWGAVAHAAITPSVPINGGPSVSAGANGSTIIDINAAGKGGVSHNIYSEFDVDRGGVVLNNSAAGSTSHLAGNIAGNANLAGGSASIILNEVNSTRASQLNGLIEVAGDKAQVIVANPAGISCSGCGFINADRATLTTGKALVANGALLGYTVEKGNVIINGDGLNSGDADYTDIIARAVQINADIVAQDLKITAGRNNVNADNTQINALTPAGSRPAVAIDVAKLGGMYANKITLVSTDYGVGVRNAGTVGAMAGDLNITTDGVLENKGVLSAHHDVNIDTTQARNRHGYYYYAHGRAVNNTANGVISAGKNLNIDLAKGRLNNVGGELLADGDINIVSGDIDNRNGKIHSQGAVDMRNDPYHYGYKRTLNNTAGVIHGFDGVAIASNGLNNTDGTIKSDMNGIDIHTAGYTLTNTRGTIESCCELNLDVGTLTNNSGLIQSTESVTINTNRRALTNQSGVIRGGTDVSISSLGVNNHAGRIMADNHLNINANGSSITNTNNARNTDEAGLFSGKGGMTLVASSINNSNGKMVSKGNVITHTSSSLSNANGLIDSDGSIMVTTSSLNNGNGTINAAEDVVIDARSISNTKGAINAGGEATLTLAGGYSHQGTLSAKEGIRINAEKGTVYNYGTLTSANGKTVVNSRSFSNQRNALVDSPAGVELVLGKSGSFTNHGAVNGNITINKQ
ncbi:filamentous hemagglutinin N-terminal domain-containing protein [Serratia rubidaea]|uniref:Filamentous hemagglutinin N-terminal domain-containing protein n=1 Tax=Serratia rubidaea TaxID=61652 RepID=A0A3S4YJS3_SERRU|nr:filamentous hemagglutinin N-terminal domain-containing protein [Serratia rubidaea]MBH1929881.1 filamentous hemagglutinin N-terminal domain-containing protein [Serratia rubidaea]MDC6120812.1 filamentous hemagglutinin N-terminal domain-containing protein [Serratia rubidaea]MEB7587010.1 filamentous hemagglutinin N-terminal domain-containing protein [Serratia rubidaea]VEI62198.1 Hemolysin precursor [Serratia rubidaea]